jgi:DHA1 family inner membrane transport protein
MPSVIGMFIVLVLVLASFTVTDHLSRLSVATVFVWGAVAFALVSPLQMRVVNEASGAPNLASTLNQGAFNLGNAAGAFAGDLALTHGLSYGNVPWIGAGLAAAGLAVALVSYRLDRRGGIFSAVGMRQSPAQTPIQVTS